MDTASTRRVTVRLLDFAYTAAPPVNQTICLPGAGSDGGEPSVPWLCRWTIDNRQFCQAPSSRSYTAFLPLGSPVWSPRRRSVGEVDLKELGALVLLGGEHLKHRQSPGRSSRYARLAQDHPHFRPPAPCVRPFSTRSSTGDC